LRIKYKGISVTPFNFSNSLAIVFSLSLIFTAKMAQPGTRVDKSLRKVFPAATANPKSRCSNVNSLVQEDWSVFLISIDGKEDIFLFITIFVELFEVGIR